MQDGERNLGSVAGDIVEIGASRPGLTRGIGRSSHHNPLVRDGDGMVTACAWRAVRLAILVLCDGPVLRPGHLPREVQTPDLAHSTMPRSSSPSSFADAEREALIEALRRANGNKAQAAKLLGIHRGTIYVKLRQFGLSV